MYNMILIDPGYRPPPASISARVLMARPVRELESPLDRDILAVLRDTDEPISGWRVANLLAIAHKPGSRKETRDFRLRVMNRLNPLVKAGFARRIGRSFLTSACL